MARATAGTMPCKQWIYIFPSNSQMSRSVQYAYRTQNLLKLNMQCQCWIPMKLSKTTPKSFTFSKIRQTWSFQVVVLQKTAEKCTKICSASAQALFSSLNLLFCGVLVVIAAVFCLRSRCKEVEKNNCFGMHTLSDLNNGSINHSVHNSCAQQLQCVGGTAYGRNYLQTLQWRLDSQSKFQMFTLFFGRHIRGLI